MADENMKRAHARDAILNTKFWFRTDVTRREDYQNSDLHTSDFLRSTKINNEGGQDEESKSKPKYEELFIHEILAGNSETGFIGIYPLIRKFMEVK